MANQYQFELLRQGLQVWNQWRKEHPDIRPDISGASLNEANLSEEERISVGLISENPLLEELI